MAISDTGTRPIPTLTGKYGGESRKPIAGAAAGEPAGHLQRGRHAVGGDEAELAGGGGVPAAGDDDGAETVERRPAAVPVRER